MATFLFQTNLYLALFYGFYWALLRNETFFTLNRIYLLAGLLLAWAIPFIQSDWLQSWFITQEVGTQLYEVSVTYVPVLITPKANAFTWEDFAVQVYWVGVGIMAVRFCWACLQVQKLLENPEKGTAFSFFGFQFVSKSLAEQPAINLHEATHCQQGHSFDVLLAEVFLIFCWFNPVAYFYKKALQQTHEFIADERASAQNISKADYALLLFQEHLGVRVNPLTNQFFNVSLLKRRILMLQQPRSRQTALLKYGLSAPLFLMMLVFSSASIAAFKPLESVEKLMQKEPTKTNLGAFLPTSIATFKPLESVENLIQKDSTKTNLDEMVITSPTQGVPAPPPPPSTYPKPPKPKAVKGIGQVFSTVDELPEFPGGVSEMYKFIGRNLKYPTLAQRNNVQGKIYLTFIVKKDGGIGNIKVLQGIGTGCEEEAIRVIKLMPKWTAGKHKGKTVNVQYTLPIAFMLEGEEPPKKQGNLYKPNGDNLGSNSTNPIRFISGKDGLDFDGVVLLNGQEVENATLAKINPADIERLSVLKDAESLKKFGKQAISIELKNQKKNEYFSQMERVGISLKSLKEAQNIDWGAIKRMLDNVAPNSQKALIISFDFETKKNGYTNTHNEITVVSKLNEESEEMIANAKMLTKQFLEHY